MGSRRARPAASGASPHRSRPLGEVEDRFPALGQLGDHLHVLRAHPGHEDGDPLPYRVVDQLQRLAEPGPLPGGQRQLVVPAVVDQPLAAPHHPADLDDLPGTADRRVVGNPVPPLDHLRPRRPDAEREPAAGNVVEPGRGHRGQRGRARVQLEDPRGDLQPLGPGGDEAKLADRVEAVGLGHEHDLQARLLVVGELLHRLRETARVVQRHPNAHRDRPFAATARTAWRTACNSSVEGNRRPCGRQQRAYFEVTSSAIAWSASWYDMNPNPAMVPSATAATTEVWRNGSRAAGLLMCTSTSGAVRIASASRRA